MSSLPAGPRIAIGLALTAVGIGLAAFGAVGALHAAGGMQLVAIPAGLAFVFAGAFVLLPDRLATPRLALGALMATSLALVFDWVAFGPGSGSSGARSASAAPASTPRSAKRPAAPSSAFSRCSSTSPRLACGCG